MNAYLTHARCKIIAKAISESLTPANWTHLKTVFGGVIFLGRYGV